MEIITLVTVAVALFLILLTVYFLQQKNQNKPVQSPDVRRVTESAQIPRRAQILRNQRNRLRTAGEDINQRELNDSDDETNRELKSDEKLGAKKRAKLEAKAEKKLQREQEMKFREEKKKQEALEEEERKKLEEKEKEEEKRQEDEERRLREEKERREYEEYLKLKESFNVEEEGFEEEEEENDLLQEFVKYIKENKVVVLEDVASHFKIKVQQAIDRIAELQKGDIITGVIDDRGKFIYISESELQAVAKFIRQRGRISILELAESSNSLINLTPVC